MKKIRNSLPVFFVIFTSLFFSRCTIGDDIQQLKNTVDSLQIVVGTPSFDSQVHLEFVDAKTQAYLSNKSVFVTVSGKDANAVFNNLGEKKTKYEAKLSFMDLILDPNQINADKMKTTPVEFDVTVKSPGYADVTKKVYFNSASKQKVTIPLISLTNAPAGVQVNVNNNFASTGSDGKITQTSTVSLGAGSQSVVIPAGVVIKDKDGAVVTGAISSQVIFVDPTSPAAQSAIPGGSSVQAKLKDGSTSNVELVSAGMFFINLKAGDKDVKTFEGGGLKLKIVIPSTYVNPNTGAKVKANDNIDMWSIEEGTGKWNYERSCVVRSVNGELVVEETITHLSGWSLAYATNSCQDGPKFVFKGDISTKVDVKLIAAFASSQSYKEFTVNTANPDYQLHNVPQNQAATFTFESAATNFGEKYIFTPSSISMANMCDAKSYDITVTKAAPVNETVTINLKIIATSASQKNLAIAINAILLLSEDNVQAQKQIEFVNSATSFMVELNKDYTISLSLGTTSGEGKLKVVTQGSNYVVTFTPVQVGSTVIAPITFTEPKTADKTVNINYSVVIDSDVF